MKKSTFQEATDGSSSEGFTIYRGQSISSPKVTAVTIHQSVKEIVPESFKHFFVEQIGNVEFEEGVQVIGEGVFSMCWALGNVRLASSIHTIEKDAFAHCMLQLRSVELPPKPINIGSKAFQGCARLRNIALEPSDSELGRRIFKGCHNLSKVFQDSESLVENLTRRFERLPLHRACYYQSYFSTEECLQQFDQAINMGSRSRQDCLGMTPLHILAFSKIQRLELYEACIEHCQADLNTQDEWGSLPIHYALENGAPWPIVNFLLEQHQKFFPGQSLCLDEFFLRDGAHFFERASLPLVQLLFEFHEKYSGEPLDWEHIVRDANEMGCIDAFRYVVSKSMSARVHVLEWQPWKEEIKNDIEAISTDRLKLECWTPGCPAPQLGIEVVDEIQAKLSSFERRTTMQLLELFCWKRRMEAPRDSRSANKTSNDIRRISRIQSGSEFIVPLVVSYL